MKINCQINQDMLRLRANSSPEMAEHFKGIVQTVWSGAGPFLDRYYGRIPDDTDKSSVKCFKAFFAEIQKTSENK